jgi:acyl-CoA hydrolase
MKKIKRTVKASQVQMTELVLPNDTNQLGNLLGGTLMHWVDIAAAMSASRHSGRICVTASVDEMNFLMPVKLGQVVHIIAQVTRAFTTSMEVGVRVEVEDYRTGDKRHVNTAFLTFVALDDFGHTVPVPEIIPETASERSQYEAAMARRNARLRRKKEIAKIEAKHTVTATKKRS